METKTTPPPTDPEASEENRDLDHQQEQQMSSTKPVIVKMDDFKEAKSLHKEEIMNDLPRKHIV